MIIITGASGTYGSAFIRKLTAEEYGDIVTADEKLLDDLENKRISARLKPEDVPQWIKDNQLYVQFIFCLSEESDSDYIQKLWKLSIEYGLPFVYASHSDEGIDEFNTRVQQQEQQPYFWAGVKFSGVEPESAAEALYFLMHNRKNSGIYDLAPPAQKLKDAGFQK